MLLKDLFMKEKSYIIEIDIDSKHYVYIEGLTNNGCCILDDNDFNVNKIDHLIFELIDKTSGDTLKVIDIKATLETPTQELIKIIKNRIEG